MVLYDGCPMGYLGYGMMGWWFPGGLLALALVGVLLYFLLRQTRQGKGAGREERLGEPPSRDMDPIDILKARYAKGDISRKEYEQMKKELEE